MNATVLKEKIFAKKIRIIELAVIVAVVAIALKILAPEFYSLSNIRNILEQVSTIGILAVGVAFVLVGGGMDISASANLCCSAIAGGLVMKNTGNIFLGIVVIFAMALAVGLLNGVAVAYFKMVPFIVSLSTMVVAEGLGVLLSQSKSVFGIPQIYIDVLTVSIFGIPLTIYVLLIITAVYWLILNKSSFGRKVFAVGSNENTAVICGINTRRVKMVTYLFSGLSSAIVAIFLMARLGCASMQMASDSTNMDVMCSAILGGVSLSGGRGNIWGAFLGACFIVTFSNVVNLAGIDYYTSLMIKGLLIIVITVMDARRLK